MSGPNEGTKRFSWGCWLAVAGVLAIILIVISPLFGPKPGRRLPWAGCVSNLNQIGKAIEMYSMAWDDRRLPLHATSQSAPAGKAWPDLLMPYLNKMQGTVDGKALANTLRCPDSTGDRLTYSLNRRAAGLDLRQIKCPQTVIGAFESVNDSPGNRNLNGDSVSHPTDERLPASGTFVAWPSDNEGYYQNWPEWARMRHRGTNNVLWADGHVSNRGSDWSPQFDPKAQEETKP